MRTILIFLTLITIQSIHGQNNVAELKSFLKNIERTDSIALKIKKANFQTLEILQVYVELDRKIDFGYKHNRILIAHFSGFDLKLNFFSKDGILIFGWLSEYDLNKEKHSDIVVFKDTPEFLESYIKHHNEYYKTELNKEDFKEQFLTEYVV